MSDRVHVVGRGAGAPPPSTGRAVRWAVVLVVIAAAFVIGRATGGDDRSAPASGADAGPSAMRAGVPVGYSQTREGAVAAALNYGAAAAREDFLNADRRRTVLGIVATPAFARRFEAEAGAGFAQALRGPLGRGLQAGTPTVYQSSPLAYHVDEYTSKRAVVSGWGLAISGNAEGLRPQADFQTTTSTLVWQDGDWKLDGGRVAAGPTPALADDAQLTPAGAFVDALSGMQTVRNAP